MSESREIAYFQSELFFPGKLGIAVAVVGHYHHLVYKSLIAERMSIKPHCYVISHTSSLEQMFEKLVKYSKKLCILDSLKYCFVLLEKYSGPYIS